MTSKLRRRKSSTSWPTNINEPYEDMGDNSGDNSGQSNADGLEESQEYGDEHGTTIGMMSPKGSRRKTTSRVQGPGHVPMIASDHHLDSLSHFRHLFNRLRSFSICSILVSTVSAFSRILAISSFTVLTTLSSITPPPCSFPFCRPSGRTVPSRPLLESTLGISQFVLQFNIPAHQLYCLVLFLHFDGKVYRTNCLGHENKHNCHRWEVVNTQSRSTFV